MLCRSFTHACISMQGRVLAKLVPRRAAGVGQRAATRRHAGAPLPPLPALYSRNKPGDTPTPSLDTTGRTGRQRRRGARLAVSADRRRGRERERALQDVLKRRVALRAPEGREAVQQLVHQDAKAPPAAARARHRSRWSRRLGRPLHSGVPAGARVRRSQALPR